MKQLFKISMGLVLVVLVLASGNGGLAQTISNPQSLLPVLIPKAAGVIAPTNAVTGKGLLTWTATTGALVTNRLWSWGDGTSTNAITSTLEHWYQSTSNSAVTLTLTVTDYGIVSSSAITTSVVVNPFSAPVAVLAPASSIATRQTGGTTVSFTNATTAALTNATWSFGDSATTSTLQKVVSHVYTNGVSTNSVILNVINPAGSSSTTGSVIISAGPSGWWN